MSRHTRVTTQVLSLRKNAMRILLLIAHDIVLPCCILVAMKRRRGEVTEKCRQARGAHHSCGFETGILSPVTEDLPFGVRIDHFAQFFYVPATGDLHQC